MFTVDAEPGAKNADGTPITPTDLRSVHDWIIRPQLLRVPGVVEVNPIGGYKKEILVAPDPAKLLAYGISHRGRCSRRSKRTTAIAALDTSSTTARSG